MIAGLETVDGGEIRIGERRVDHLPPGARGVAMVFQQYALYPHMSVRENMAFGLRNARVPADERSEEHTSELQSLMRISYAVFCLKKKKQTTKIFHMT